LHELIDADIARLYCCDMTCDRIIKSI